MKNILSKEDAKRFLSKNKWWIIGTGVVVFILYTVLSLYNIFSIQETEEVDEYYQEYSQEEIVEILEILEQDPEEVRPDVLSDLEDSLNANSVEFRLFIENQNQEPFGDEALLKDFLILDEVVEYVENEAGVELPVDPDLSVLVIRRDSQPVLSVQLRTGDLEDNAAIAEAYMQALEEEVVPFTADKQVYLLDQEPDRYEIPLMQQILESVALFSPVTIIVGAIGSFIAGLFLGVILAVGKTMWEKKVSELYIVQDDVNDHVLPFYRIKDTEEQLNQKVIKAILYPHNKKKLVLAQHELDEEVVSALKGKQIAIASDVSVSSNDYAYDEVVVIVEIDRTTKAWYESQRIQLEKMNVEVTIIQL